MRNLDDMKKRIAETRSALDEEYYNLGKKIYEITDNEIDKINKLVDILIEFRVDLHSFSKMIICGKCTTENIFTNNYCPNCGTKLIADQSPN